jgi:hypothetical protein
MPDFEHIYPSRRNDELGMTEFADWHKSATADSSIVPSASSKYV